MNAGTIVRLVAASIVAAAPLVAQDPRPAAGGQRGSGQSGAFRSRITVVPLDVRVVDRDGKVVTDLTPKDFSVTEDGVGQAISYFSAHGLTPEAPGPSGTPLPLRAAPGRDGDLRVQNRRVFLIVLGRGRMQGPAKEFPGLVDFISKGLLPQDHVALLAYNRATDFTTDRAALLAVVERFRKRQETIESLMVQHFSGLRAVYGSREIPPRIQGEIDAVFAGASALRPREIRPGQISDGARIQSDVRRTADALQLAEARAGRDNVLRTLADTTDPDRGFDRTFDEYIADQVELNQDLANLYAGIDYLRHIDGEKHLVFMTARGLLLPRMENERSLGGVAADARVAIDIIFTGGTTGAPPPRFDGRGGITMAPTASLGASFAQSFTFQALRGIAELTGGRATTAETASRAFARIDSDSRFQYLLGYAPTNTAVDGRLRRVSVTVNRPGLTVQHRRGYYASTQLIPLDRRQFVTHNRMTSAGTYAGTINDIEISINAVDFMPATGELAIKLALRSPRVVFGEADANGRRTATLDIAIFCGDDRQRLAYEAKQRIDLVLGSDALKAFAETGTAMTARVRTAAPPPYVKVIVYDYAADILGSAVWKK